MFEDFKGAISQRKWNEFLTALESRLQMRGGKGVLVKSGPGGYLVSSNAKATPSRFSHPWKATSNGDDTIKVAPGEAYHWDDGGPNSGAALINVVEYEGSDSVAIEHSGTSYVYAKMPVGSAQVIGGTSNKQLAGTVTIESSDTEPGDLDISSDVYLHLATVDKTDGVVTITKQHLKHNPIVSLQDSTHPWQVVANGDATVYVNPGHILFWQAGTSGSTPNNPLYQDYTSYAGGNLTISELCKIYAVLPVSELVISEDSGSNFISLVYVPDGSITVAIDPTFSGDNLYFLIAEADLVDGVAAVTSQFITHNPPLDVGYGYPLPP